jgi:hypothetical protein
MARVVAALEADDALRALRQPVDDLALALIAPLGADDDDVLAICFLPVQLVGSASASRVAASGRSPTYSTPNASASCRRYSVKPVAGRERPNALPMPS